MCACTAQNNTRTTFFRISYWRVSSVYHLFQNIILNSEFCYHLGSWFLNHLYHHYYFLAVFRDKAQLFHDQGHLGSDFKTGCFKRENDDLNTLYFIHLQLEALLRLKVHNTLTLNTNPEQNCSKNVVWLNCCAANDLVTFVANHTSAGTAYKELKFCLFTQALMENDH